MPSRVSVVDVHDDLDAAVRRAVELAGGLEIHRGEQLLIKPNMCCGQPSGSGLVTNVDVVAAVVRLVQDLGATALVGDLPICGWDPEETYQKVGIQDAVEKAGGKFVDFAKSELVRIKLPRAKKLTKVTLVKLVLEVDGIIDVPVLKTHFFTGHTGAIKNLKGLTSQDQRTRMHVLGLHLPIVDLFEYLLPQIRYSIVDGTTAADAVRMDGPFQGPAKGDPIRMNIILAGRDALAVDATIARMIGFNPEKLTVLKLAYERELGELHEIETVGEAAETFRKLRSSRKGRFVGKIYGIWSSRFLNPITHRLAKRLFHGDEHFVTLKTAMAELQDEAGEGIIELTGECTGCGVCVKACKLKAVKLVNGKPHFDTNRCVRCYICVEACPETALGISLPQKSS